MPFIFFHFLCEHFLQFLYATIFQNFLSNKWKSSDVIHALNTLLLLVCKNASSLRSVFLSALDFWNSQKKFVDRRRSSSLGETKRIED